MKTKMSLATMHGRMNRNEMKQITGGTNEEAADCIKDGDSCSWIRNCCNVCVGATKCGTKTSNTIEEVDSF